MKLRLSSPNVGDAKTSHHAPSSSLIELTPEINNRMLLGSLTYYNAVALLPHKERNQLIMMELNDTNQRSVTLSAADVIRLFPHISIKQLRDWDKAGLVRARRMGKGKLLSYDREQLLPILLTYHVLKAGWSKQRLLEATGKASSQACKMALSIRQLTQGRPITERVTD